MSVTLNTQRMLPTPPPPVTREIIEGNVVYKIEFKPSSLVNYAEAMFHFHDEILRKFDLDIDVSKVRTHRNGKYQLIGFEYRLDS